MEQQITKIAISNLDPHPHNPRGPVDPVDCQELAASIRQVGILEPLIVVPQRAKGQDWKIERYTVIAGHRRLVGAQAAGLMEAPCIVRELSPIEQEEIMLVENLQREDLSLLQEARAFQRLIDAGQTLADITRKIGYSSSTVAQRLNILELPPSVQALYSSLEMPVQAAPLLLRVKSKERQLRLAQQMEARQISIPKLKAIVNELEAEKGKANSAPVKKEKKQAEPPYTREDALKDLEFKNDASLTYKRLMKAFEASCHKCGLKYHPEICINCPLPQLVNRLVNGEGDGKTA